MVKSNIVGMYVYICRNTKLSACFLAPTTSHEGRIPWGVCSQNATEDEKAPLQFVLPGAYLSKLREIE